MNRNRKKGQASAAPSLPDIPEKGIQKQLNDMLLAHRIKHIRIPDVFWFWLHNLSNAPEWLKMQLGASWGGLPDNMMLVPVSGKYMLCCPIECKKKKGRRRGKQLNWEDENLPFQITKDPDQSIAIVQKFMADVPAVRDVFRTLTKYCCPECGGTGVKTACNDGTEKSREK